MSKLTKPVLVHACNLFECISDTYNKDRQYGKMNQNGWQYFKWNQSYLVHEVDSYDNRT